jgi:hypothetical protein
MRANDGSPNALSALFASRAVDMLYPGHDGTIVANVSVDLRAALGVSESHHGSVGTIPVPYLDEFRSLSLENCATCYRGRIMLESDPDTLKAAATASRGFFTYLQGLPSLAEKAGMCTAILMDPKYTHTFNVSYTGRQDLGKLAEHIDFVYALSDMPCAFMLIEIMCVGPRFFFTVLQTYDDESFVFEFMRQMERAGIGCVGYAKAVQPQVLFCDLDQLPVAE